MPVKLKTPRFRVVMADDTIHEIQAIHVDLLAWDRTRVRHGWPQLQENQEVWAGFLAWHVLTRTGDIPTGMTLKEFESAAVEVSIVEVAGVDVAEKIDAAMAAGAGLAAGADAVAGDDDQDVVSPIRPGLVPG